MRDGQDNEPGRENNITVIEDAAQAIFSSYGGRPCGTFGKFGCFSFHETKNIQCGEGGAILVSDPKLVDRADVIREKGTNRTKFFNGLIDKYTWIDIGSSYLLNEMSSAFLLAQLEAAEEITADRKRAWNSYFMHLKPLSDMKIIKIPFIPEKCQHNGHIFYIKAKDGKERNRSAQYLKAQGVGAVFHYVPLHSSPAGLKFGRFHGKDVWTTKESERLVRLPLFYKIAEEEIRFAVNAIYKFWVNHLKR